MLSKITKSGIFLLILNYVSFNNNSFYFYKNNAIVIFKKIKINKVFKILQKKVTLASIGVFLCFILFYFHTVLHSIIGSRLFQPSRGKRNWECCILMYIYLYLTYSYRLYAFTLFHFFMHFTIIL